MFRHADSEIIGKYRKILNTPKQRIGAQCSLYVLSAADIGNFQQKQARI